jgi:hypothetical protein
MRNYAVHEEVKDWFVNIADNERQIFLARLSNELTIHGRDIGLDYTAVTVEQKIRVFKGLNELQHQISQHIANLGDGSARYPDDVLWQILQEKAAAHGLTNHLNSSIKRVRPFCSFVPGSKAIH